MRERKKCFPDNIQYQKMLNFRDVKSSKNCYLTHLREMFGQNDMQDRNNRFIVNKEGNLTISKNTKNRKYRKNSILPFF